MTMKSINLIAASSLAVLSALAVSCSEGEDVKQDNQATDDGAIRFAASTEFSRAGDITTNNLTSFNVYAYTGTTSAPVTFMDNVVVSKSASNSWTYSPLQYWPAKQAVDFYAFAPAS